MNTEENTLGRILGAMRDAAPPAGMEQRIHNALDAIATECQHSRAGSLRDTFSLDALRGAGLLRWASIAALAAVAVTTGVGLYTHRSSSSVRHAVAPHVAAPTVARDEAMPQKIAGASPAEASGVAASRRRKGGLSIEPVSKVQRSEAAQAEVAIVSHPAPPMPPTVQERLLLQYARHGHPADLVQVSDDRRSEEQQREAAEFHAFFQPPPSVIGESE